MIVLMLMLVARINDRVIRFPLTADLKEITAGSLPDNPIYLPYKGISRRHFALRKKNSEWILLDLGSKNGTSLNGERIKEAKIESGDKIKAGVAELQVEVDAVEDSAIPLESDAAANRDTTDEISSTRLDSDENIFSFPRLVFPEGWILNQSTAMLEIYEKLHAVIESDISVLFVGETGTGKEMLAKTIHLSSQRTSSPFIAVNCAAIPADLMEAELFGIGDKVATNVSQRKGKIQAAAGGTLFLDELEAFPFSLQSKILRVVEEKTVTAVGEYRSVAVDFRLVSATNEEPSELIRKQKLREDLYHRLSTLEIHIPPLRERKGDLQTLIPGILQHLAARERKKFGGISKRLMDILLVYSYPGNIRELVNILKAAVALAHSGEVLDVHLVPERLFEKTDGKREEEPKENKMSLKSAVDDFTRNRIVQTLQENDGNIRRTAEQLDLTTQGLRKVMKRLNINGSDQR